jgi:hypothetical protein
MSLNKSSYEDDDYYNKSLIRTDVGVLRSSNNEIKKVN